MNEPVQVGDLAAVTGLLAQIEAHDGVAPVSEEHLLALHAAAGGVSADAEHGAWLRRAGGAPVALLTRARDALELAVHPGERRRGHAGALLRGVLKDAPNLALWAHGDLPAARAFADRFGLVRVRELLRLERPLTVADADLPTLPGVVTLADLPDADADAALRAWLDLNSLAFAEHPEQGRWTWADLTTRTAQDWFDPAHLLLLPTPDGAGIDASIWLKATGRGIEVYVLAVHPARAGHGLGRALLTHALGEVARQGGFDVVELYVDGGNRPALALYDRAGFAVVERHAQYVQGGSATG